MIQKFPILNNNSNKNYKLHCSQNLGTLQQQKTDLPIPYTTF